MHDEPSTFQQQESCTCCLLTGTQLDETCHRASVMNLTRTEPSASQEAELLKC
jgi:hypothetical protein